MRRKVIVVLLAALAGAGIGAALGYGPLLRYKSEGVLSVEMGTAEYRRISELANDSSTARRFAKLVPPKGLDAGEIDRLVREVAQGDWQKPVPRISKADARELPDLLLQLEQEREKAERDRAQDDPDRRPPANVYLGVRLTAIAPTPVEAANVATWLGAYFKDMATLSAVRQQVSAWTAENRQFSDRASERRLKYQFDIEQAQVRATALKKVIAAYPDSARREASQVVDVRKDNEKFMSPMAQLVAAESEVITIREKIQKLDRELQQQSFMKALTVEAASALAQVHSGSDSVVRISAVISEFNKKIKTDAEREKLSTLTADISVITARFLSQPQFVAEPSVPDRPERPRPLMAIVLMAVLAALLSAMFLWRDTLLKALLIQGKNKA
ncbi:hypothetical protein [Cupriavidus sp. CuC1]|uniref:hypothetical protein n=1 Tax=Cupriavidus sp. CuC1 TaxID=3373131 RepID=UPI0037D3898B